MITFLVSAIRLGMALLFGSTGETISEKAGNLNLGIPGVMCVGAACGCLAESIYYTSVNGKLFDEMVENTKEYLTEYFK